MNEMNECILQFSHFPLCQFVLRKIIRTCSEQARQIHATKKPGETKQNAQLLAGLCRTLKFVETLQNLETNSLNEDTSPVFPTFFHGI